MNPYFKSAAAISILLQQLQKKLFFSQYKHKLFNLGFEKAKLSCKVAENSNCLIVKSLPWAMATVWDSPILHQMEKDQQKLLEPNQKLTLKSKTKHQFKEVSFTLCVDYNNRTFHFHFFFFFGIQQRFLKAMGINVITTK